MVYILGRDNSADSLFQLLGKSAAEETHKHGAEDYVRFVATNANTKALTTRELEEDLATVDKLRELRSTASG